MPIKQLWAVLLSMAATLGLSRAACSIDPVYIMYTTGGCVGRNELGTKTKATVRDCAEECNARPNCVSFEFSSDGKNRCQLSSSCDSFDKTVNQPFDPFDFYLKFKG